MSLRHIYAEPDPSKPFKGSFALKQIGAANLHYSLYSEFHEPLKSIIHTNGMKYIHVVQC
jgi:hypothetical protein